MLISHHQEDIGDFHIRDLEMASSRSPKVICCGFWKSNIDFPMCIIVTMGLFRNIRPQFTNVTGDKQTDDRRQHYQYWLMACGKKCIMIIDLEWPLGVTWRSCDFASILLMVRDRHIDNLTLDHLDRGYLKVTKVKIVCGSSPVRDWIHAYIGHLIHSMTLTLRIDLVPRPRVDHPSNSWASCYFSNNFTKINRFTKYFVTSAYWLYWRFAVVSTSFRCDYSTLQNVKIRFSEKSNTHFH